MVLTREKVAVKRQKGEEQRSIGYARVWFEYGEDAQKRGDHEERLSSQPDSQATDVSSQVKPEYTEEKPSEGIEHLDEEIPPQPDIRCQIRDQQLEAIGRRHEFAEIVNDQR